MMRHGKRFTTFQSTLPREERLFEVKNLGKVLLFQSTLPREERHRGNRRRSDCYNFNPRSHERSDEVEAKRKAKLEISIHAPTRGATSLIFPHIRLDFDFNPRSHERSDVSDRHSCLCVGISIHAPTRGATLQTKEGVRLEIFQSTLPREERRSCSSTPSGILIFQSTLPREERHSDAERLSEYTNISIHAPTRGATVTMF